MKSPLQLMRTGLAGLVGRKHEQVQEITEAAELLRLLSRGRQSKGNIAVNVHTALQVSAVLACVRVIANGLAQVPFKVHRAAEGRREVAREHPLYYLLHTKPNPWQTSFEYRETIAIHLCLARAHYSFINRIGNRIVELIPFEPGQVCTERLRDGTIRYVVTLANGVQQEYPAESIWHIRGMSWNGWEGMDPIALTREAIGLSIAAEEEHSRLFANGISTSGTYSVEGKLDESQWKKLRKFLMESQTGVNAGLPMILDSGAKWISQRMSGVDAQHAETRRFQVEEIARGMGVMPIMIYANAQGMTFASAEQQFIAHVVHTLLPWYQRVQTSADAYLLGRREVEQGYYTRFNPSALLRGSAKDRADYFAKALGAGGAPAWMTQDEVRELEELNPMGGTAASLPMPTNVATQARPGQPSTQD